MLRKSPMRATLREKPDTLNKAIHALTQPLYEGYTT